MKRIVLLISLMILFSTISIFAQNRTTIYGNVGVENANIRVLNTQYGTSSDVKGNYSFSIYGGIPDGKEQIHQRDGKLSVCHRQLDLHKKDR